MQTVDALGLDDYVRGVIAAEMPAELAGRGAGGPGGGGAHLRDHDQRGGNGYYALPRHALADVPAAWAPRPPQTDAAVAATRGRSSSTTACPATTYFFCQLRRPHREHRERLAGATPEPWLRGVPDPYDGAGGDPYHRWGADYSLAAAAAKLRGLVKGSLIGVTVLRHGASPRILLADVVGSRGTHAGDRRRSSSSASGCSPRWPLSPTITDRPGSGRGRSARAPHAAAGPVQLQRALVAARLPPACTATSFPGAPAIAIASRRSSRGSWKTDQLRLARALADRSRRALAGPGLPDRLAGASRARRRRRHPTRLRRAAGDLAAARSAGATCRAPLLAVDAPYVLYRSFFALPDSIQGADERPVNALLGAVNLLLRIAADKRPRAIVACFGAEAAAYRTELYPPYHAQRPPVPDDLAWQFEQAPGLFAAFGWSSESTDGLEADDLLGALADVEEAAGGTALIATGDRDMFQCARDAVQRAVAQAGQDRLRGGRTPTRCSAATASRRRWCPTSSPCAATRPTGCPARPGSGPRPRPSCSTRHGSLEARDRGAARASARRSPPR